jgi:hypothetical protein
MSRSRLRTRVLTLAAVAVLSACGTATPTIDGPDAGALPAPQPSAVTAAPTVTASESAAPESEASTSASPTASFTADSDDSGGSGGSEEDTSAPTASPGSSASAGSARALLATLAVKGRAAQTGYERERYGQAWADVDRNGCDTRNDMLRRDLRSVVFKPGTRDCVVASGVLDPEPYTGARIDFVRGETSSMAVQIDHVVALADSWVSGAFAWDERKRIAFGNDPLNLLAVDGPANAQKGAGDAATWLPRSAFRCAYVARQIAVKAKYELWVKPAERDAMARILDTCPDEPAPAYGPVELPPPGLGSAERAEPTAPAAPAATPVPSSGLDPRFPYCTDAKAAGYGPYVKGKDGEYAWYRDADSDGIVCE